jgi:hypothetical protein
MTFETGLFFASSALNVNDEAAAPSVLEQNAKGSNVKATSVRPVQAAFMLSNTLIM